MHWPFFFSPQPPPSACKSTWLNSWRHVNKCWELIGPLFIVPAKIWKSKLAEEKKYLVTINKQIINFKKITFNYVTHWNQTVYSWITELALKYFFFHKKIKSYFVSLLNDKLLKVNLQYTEQYKLSHFYFPSPLSLYRPSLSTSLFTSSSLSTPLLWCVTAYFELKLCTKFYIWALLN